jgi:hypothetical protein
MIYGYARVWTNVQSVAAQVAALRKLTDAQKAGARRRRAQGATLAELARS